MKRKKLITFNVWLFGLTDDFFQLIANYCIAKIIWLPNRTLLPLLPIRKVIADSFQSNSHWIAMGSKDPFLHCKHNYAGKNLTTHRSWSNEKFNVANNALNTSTAISYKKGFISVTQICCVSILIFSNHPNIGILLLLFICSIKAICVFFFGCIFVYLHIWVFVCSSSLNESDCGVGLWPPVYRSVP